MNNNKICSKNKKNQSNVGYLQDQKNMFQLKELFYKILNKLGRNKKEQTSFEI